MVIRKKNIECLCYGYVYIYELRVIVGNMNLIFNIKQMYQLKYKTYNNILMTVHEKHMHIVLKCYIML